MSLPYSSMRSWFKLICSLLIEHVLVHVVVTYDYCFYIQICRMYRMNYIGIVKFPALYHNTMYNLVYLCH